MDGWVGVKLQGQLSPKWQAEGLLSQQATSSSSLPRFALIASRQAVKIQSKPYCTFQGGTFTRLSSPPPKFFSPFYNKAFPDFFTPFPSRSSLRSLI